MTAYVAIPNGDIDQDSPATQPLFTALRDNPIAIAEAATGAPKRRQVNSISGTVAITQTFTGLGDYDGVEFSISARRTGGAGTIACTIEYSTNGGSTWSATFQLASTVGNPYRFYGDGAIDFATGDVVFLGSRSDVDGMIRASGNMAGASLSIDALRFSLNSGEILAIVRPKGATV